MYIYTAYILRMDCFCAKSKALLIASCVLWNVAECMKKRSGYYSLQIFCCLMEIEVVNKKLCFLWRAFILGFQYVFIPGIRYQEIWAINDQDDSSCEEGWHHNISPAEHCHQCVYHLDSYNTMHNGKCQRHHKVNGDL